MPTPLLRPSSFHKFLFHRQLSHPEGGIPQTLNTAHPTSPHSHPDAVHSKFYPHSHFLPILTHFPPHSPQYLAPSLWITRDLSWWDKREGDWSSTIHLFCLEDQGYVANVMISGNSSHMHQNPRRRRASSSTQTSSDKRKNARLRCLRSSGALFLIWHA